MTFEEANDIIARRYGYHMATIPTEEEVHEAEMAFRPKRRILCHECERYYECFMISKRMYQCNFFEEEKKG